VTIASCRATGHHEGRADGFCPGCGQTVANACTVPSCGHRLYYADRMINDGLCAPCRRAAGITPLPPRLL
jgi:hypothetical protein